MLEIMLDALAAVLREASPWDGGGEDAALSIEKELVHA